MKRNKSALILGKQFSPKFLGGMIISVDVRNESGFSFPILHDRCHVMSFYFQCLVSSV